MEFEWDEGKAHRNWRKHGVSFEEATSVFADPFEVAIADPDHSAVEERFISVGASAAGRLLVVGYVDRGDKIRIIFARRATLHERHDYED